MFHTRIHHRKCILLHSSVINLCPQYNPELNFNFSNRTTRRGRANSRIRCTWMNYVWLLKKLPAFRPFFCRLSFSTKIYGSVCFWLGYWLASFGRCCDSSTTIWSGLQIWPIKLSSISMTTILVDFWHINLNCVNMFRFLLTHGCCFWVSPCEDLLESKTKEFLSLRCVLWAWFLCQCISL